MKSLSQVKTQYAEERRFKSWEHFCSVANDDMFIRAIDDVAQLFAQALLNETKPQAPKVQLNFATSKRNKRGRNPFIAGFSK